MQPQAKNNVISAVVPPFTGAGRVLVQVVSDQIRLWQKEVERVTMVPAYLYSDFENEAVWRGTCDEARRLGAHLWQATPHPARASTGSGCPSPQAAALPFPTSSG